MKQETYSFEQWLFMTDRVQDLIAARQQFAVSLAPQGMDQVRTGWVLSFPEQAQQSEVTAA